MFDREYTFRGKHATFVKELKNEFGMEGKLNVFERNIDVYVLAPIVGFIYKRQSTIDTVSDLKNDIAKIGTDQILDATNDIKYNFRLIMLLDKKYEPNLEKRVTKAFQYLETQQEKEYYDSEEGKRDLEIFNSYVLGGVEYLYENIILGKIKNDYTSNAIEFIKKFDDEYNKTIDDILC